MKIKIVVLTILLVLWLPRYFYRRQKYFSYKAGRSEIVRTKLYGFKHKSKAVPEPIYRRGRFIWENHNNI
jgi:hypothetical protein